MQQPKLDDSIYYTYEVYDPTSKLPLLKAENIDICACEACEETTTSNSHSDPTNCHKLELWLMGGSLK